MLIKKKNTSIFYLSKGWLFVLKFLLNLSLILIGTPVQIKHGFIILVFLSSWLFHKIWVIFTFLCFSLIVSHAFWIEICIISVWNWISINYQTRWRILTRSILESESENGQRRYWRWWWFRRRIPHQPEWSQIQACGGSRSRRPWDVLHSSRILLLQSPI
jgi:hypothetical protein